MDVEHCWAIFGGNIGPLWYGKLKKLSVGTPCEVKFDYNTVMDQEIKDGNLLGFFHLHPSFLAIPSETDRKTMHCWSLSTGKSLICAIRGTDGLRVYDYIDDESPPIECKYAKIIGNIIFGIDGDAVLTEELEDEYV